ncbi:MAG TPA: cellulase family glycosylhydrolase [Bryobacteraceae bacterium]|nr:cellulase family glycosylhydrolase [Bryobacteraceae bacterium]
MPRDLSSNLPDLITAGSRILRADTMQPVLLRGVNRSGLEYTEPTEAGFLQAAGFTADEVWEIVESWHSNVIRVPFNQDWALHGRRGHSAGEYLTSLDQVIAWAAALGAYTIVDLQWLDAETVYGHVKDEHQGKRENHVAPTPNDETIELWNTLATRYREEPAVLFDLLNEPHDPLPDDFLPIHVLDTNGVVVESDSGFVGPEEWTPWAARLVQEVRQIRPNGLLLVEGVDWGFDLRGVRVEAPNVVYSAHIYSNRKPRTWSRALENAADAPVFIGEWGGTDGDLDFARTLTAWMRQQDLGWAAWSWVDYPKLVQPPRAPVYEPTLFGAFVREELRRVDATKTIRDV